MTEPSIIFNEVNERQGVFTRRVFLMGGITGVGIGMMSGRLAQLQLLQTNSYRRMAEENQYNRNLVIPPRGVIVDRNRVPLASNRPNFRLYVTRDSVKDIDSTLEAVGQLLPLSEERRAQIRKTILQSPRFAQVSIADDMTWEQFAAVTVRSPELRGVTADMGEARVYPYGGAFSHVIGYVSKASDRDLKATKSEPDALTIHPGFRIGKVGVERSLDKRLRGTPGFQMVEVDHRGRIVGKDPRGDIPSRAGDEVVLSLDVDIQNRAMEVFGAESGAAVMMDCRSGDILCMFSGPSFDANRFVKGVPTAEYRALSDYDHKPLLNKALQATYPPGSTFKTMVALAALENGVDPKRTYHCSGAWNFGRTFHCDAVHGSQDMKSAIATSCDIFFYQTALAIGPDKIAAVARRFGLGEIFDIGIPNQVAGLVPDTAYKKKTFPKDPVWHPGETPSMGIGQGYTHLNPLQLCVMTSRLANGHKALHPRLIRSVGGVEQPSGAAFGDLPFDPAHIAFVKDAMAAVTTVGTAARFGDLGLGDIRMAGKTGTAQAYSYGGGRGVHGTAGAWKLRDHAWFIAFAPQDAPRFAMSVLVEHGGFGGTAAAPRAREIMRVALLKDPEMVKRIQNPLPAPPPIPQAETPETAYREGPIIDPGAPPVIAVPPPTP